jgi:hypothetical protein
MDDKSGVFISHITAERATAALLKDYLQQVFGNDLRIFVSSDYDSIPGGDIWFQTILKGLKSSAVIIVLLSPDSQDRPWINFEAGVGVGTDALVIPVVVHGLTRGKVGHPLINIQIRSLETVADAHALLNDVGSKIARIRKSVDLTPLVTFASQGMAGAGWSGIDWGGRFLAVDGPVLKLREIEDQWFEEGMEKALRSGGFAVYKAGMVNLTPSLSKGYKIVYVTDRTTYRARIISYDTVLVAKPETPS